MEQDTDDYCDITSQLDAREILRYLNNLGIRNINGEVLKYFITDLKKLIKYDLQHTSEDHSEKTHRTESVGIERLHSASTFSSRTRSKAPFASCPKECQRPRRVTNLRNIHSAPNIGHQLEEIKTSRRSCSCVRIEKKIEIPKGTPKTTVSSNLIKVPKQQIKKKCDPVSLYHYYMSLWEKYKPNVPGENNWADLRWNIRQKMVGNSSSQTSNKVQGKQDTFKRKKTPCDI
ncbi:hydrolethalus syndrome protein 1 homolog [Vanessa atalanta]|uniref:hydrolethalus syndrome protein 1 homolog n=1 Tax=Vanessa atalanta TaxID=42275 RepID=UPI001FCE1697|nr:hydrolethalus syndrome protein 1 homolog [Vanessa atalanta]